MENPSAVHPYATAKTVVIWNAEACKIPSGINASDVLPRIEASLSELGYVGPLEVIAIAANDNCFNPVETESLQRSGIKVANFGDQHEGIVDSMILNMIMNDLLRVTKAPANVLIISGDGRLSDQLNDLKSLDYNVMYAFRPEEAAATVLQIPTTWEWLKLLKLEN